MEIEKERLAEEGIRLWKTVRIRTAKNSCWRKTESEWITREKGRAIREKSLAKRRVYFLSDKRKMATRGRERRERLMPEDKKIKIKLERLTKLPPDQVRTPYPVYSII